MASFHCTVKAGASSSAGAHAQYIERDGKYASKNSDDLEAVQSGNLPQWANSSSEFWTASDEHERVNAAGYREYEVALPREMTKEQRLELVQEFVKRELGERHAYTFAIHNPRAALEGGEQPHAHIMFSERVNDGIRRDTPAHYFKRADGKQPERGGCKKANSERKTSAERKADLVALRERFATIQNKHLRRHGHADRVTHLSLKAQGIERLPSDHLGPTAAAMQSKGKPTWRGAARVQRNADLADVARIPSMERQLHADQLALAQAMRTELTRPAPSPVKPAPALDPQAVAAGMAAARANFETMKLAKAQQAQKAADLAQERQEQLDAQQPKPQKELGPSR